MQSRRTSTATVAIVLVLMVVCATIASARYLPTRSDDSRRERIKEVLRLVSSILDRCGHFDISSQK